MIKFSDIFALLSRSVLHRASVLCAVVLCAVAVSASPVQEEPIDDDTTSTQQAATVKTVSKDPLAKLSATAYCLIEVNSGGTLLLEKNSNMKMYPASMTKIMTCILAIEANSLSDTVTIGSKAAGTSYGDVKKDQRYIMRDLLDLVMLNSDNGAAQAVADHLTTEGDNFIDRMNAKARELGMNGTSFANPHGLHDSNHYSTASDMILLVQYAMMNSKFREIVSQVSHDVVTVDSSHKLMKCKNLNRLLTRYSGCIGVKTGFTTPAGGCLASAAKRGEHLLYLVVMHTNPPKERFNESETLLNAGFAKAKEMGLRPKPKAARSRGRTSVPYPKVRKATAPPRDVPPPPKKKRQN